MKNKDLIFFAAILIIAACCRWAMPESMPNFSPIGAMALFSGACIKDKRLSYLFPLAALFLSDLVLGLHDTMIFTYIGFAGVIFLGRVLKPKLGVSMIAASLAGSVFFYIISNFGFWMLYAPVKSLTSLYKVYFDAIPFFRNALLGDLFFNTIIFGIFAVFLRFSHRKLQHSIVTK